jgi:hypothetical protein
MRIVCMVSPRCLTPTMCVLVYGKLRGLCVTLTIESAPSSGHAGGCMPRHATRRHARDDKRLATRRHAPLRYGAVWVRGGTPQRVGGVRTQPEEGEGSVSTARGSCGVMPLPSTSGIERICISLWRMPMPSCYLTYAQSRKATWSEYTSRLGCWLCQRRCGRWLRTYTDGNGLGSYWVQMVDALRADLGSYGQADPAALQSRVPAHPPPPIQGTPTPLPVTQFGASGQATTVVAGQTTEQPVPAAPTAPTGPAPPNSPVPPCRCGGALPQHYSRAKHPQGSSR